MKTLYVTDLDGTLLNTNHKISDYSRQIIDALVKKDVLFTYATARSLSSAAVVTEGFVTKVPIISNNGVFIVEPDSGEILLSNFISGEQKRILKQLFEEHNVWPLAYAYVDGVEKVTWCPDFENDGIRHYLNTRKGDKRFRPVGAHELDKLYEGDSFYYTCIGEKADLQPIYDALKDSEDFNCLLHQELYRPEYWCEILPKKATKASALLELKKLLGCEKVVVFGDAVNDIPMFQVADECYAVENAVPELKAFATGIIAGNDADGVAKWLAEHV